MQRRINTASCTSSLNVLTTVTTCIFSFFLAYQLSCNTKNIVPFTKPWFCVIVIVLTRAIHASEQSYRVFTYPGSASTLLEGLKELFSSLVNQLFVKQDFVRLFENKIKHRLMHLLQITLCFMTLVDLQLQQVYGKKDLSDLEKKEFQIHWPFDLLRVSSVVLMQILDFIFNMIKVIRPS